METIYFFSAKSIQNQSVIANRRHIDGHPHAFISHFDYISLNRHFHIGLNRKRWFPKC